MSKINFDWVNQQVNDSTLSDGNKVLVVSLLKALDRLKYEEKDVEPVMFAVFKLAIGNALVPAPGPEVWIPGRRGDVIMADTMRIKHDAFTGEAGVIQNGKVGRVIAIRNGFVYLKSVDDIPLIDESHYLPEQLDKRVQ